MVTGFQPEGVHISPFGQGTMLISWSTGAPMKAPTPTPPTPYNASSVAAYVIYGATSGEYTHIVKGSHSNTYTYKYDDIYVDGVKDATGYSYASPIIHHVLLGGLALATTYYYVVGNPKDGFSDEMSFMTADPKSTMLRIGVFGDLGDTLNSSNTLASVMNYNADLILNTGDFIYADVHLSSADPADGQQYWDEFPAIDNAYPDLSVTDPMCGELGSCLVQLHAQRHLS